MNISSKKEGGGLGGVEPPPLSACIKPMFYVTVDAIMVIIDLPM